MRRSEVKRIIAYFYSIPAMRQELERERRDLEEEYDCLRSTASDGTPHGSTPGNPTAEAAERVMSLHVRERMEVIDVKRRVLEGDKAIIQDCLDGLKREYKRMIFARYRDRYSWGKIGTLLSVPESTARRWHDKAIDRLGEALDEAPMIDEISSRASRARV